jgi:hypothetical protein
VAGVEGAGEEAGSNLERKDETLPVTTGEGERFFRFILVPVPVRPLQEKVRNIYNKVKANAWDVE